MDTPPRAAGDDDWLVGERTPTPQPERGERRLRDPGLRDLSFRDFRAVVIRALKSTLSDNLTNLAAAVAYNLFLAIPSALLIVLGVFSLVAGPGAVQTILHHLSSVMPASAVALLGRSLNRITQSRGSSGVAMIAVGFVLAVWSLSGAMQTMMWALNIAYGRTETRGFVRRRAIALGMIAAGLVAFALVFVLLVLGPFMADWVGRTIGQTTATAWVWWIAQWPVLALGLLAAFAVVLHTGPDVVPRSWRFVTPGSAFALVIWLAASGAFAVYTSGFASYNKTWGSLSAVIVLLTWLWLSALALLIGGEINAEVERSRQLRSAGPREPAAGG